MKWFVAITICFTIGMLSCHKNPTPTYDIFLNKSLKSIGTTRFQFNGVEKYIKYGESGTIKVTSVEEGDYFYELNVETTDSSGIILVYGTNTSGFYHHLNQSKTCVVFIFSDTNPNNGTITNRVYHKWE